jgi:hypothetical protein
VVEITDTCHFDYSRRFSPARERVKYLFSFSKNRGMLVWEIETGEEVFEETEFFPRSYHPKTKQFLKLLPDGEFQVSRLKSA